MVKVYTNIVYLQHGTNENRIYQIQKEASIYGMECGM